MSPLGNLFVIMALPFLLTSAAECKEGDSCEKAHEETYLVQLVKSLVSRSSPQEDEEFKPLPQNHTKIDEALKRKAAGNGLPMTKHRIKENKTHHTPHHPEEKSPSSPAKPEEKPSKDLKKDVEKTKAKEDDEEKKLRKEIQSGEAGAGSSSRHNEQPKDTSGNADRARKNAIIAAEEEVDLQNLEVAEAAKNQAMAVAANAAAAEDRVALQLAAQAQKLAQANSAGPTDANDKKLAAAIAAEVSAEMDELKARSKIEKQALQDAMGKVDAAERAATQIAKDAQQEAQARAASL